MWLGPQKPSLEWTGTLLTGLFLLPLKLSRQELGKSLQQANSARKLHEQSITGQHWYLVELGVEPARQGDGVGRRSCSRCWHAPTRNPRLATSTQITN